MSKISIILFDLGGVIVNWHDYWLIREISQNFGISEEKLSKEFERNLNDLSSGKIQEIEFWHRIGQRIHSPRLQNLNNSLFYGYFKKHAKPNKSILSLSRNLKKKGLGIGILSNIEHVTYSIVEDWKLLDHFDHKFLSYKIGFSKPDRRIYQHVIESLPYKKEELFFIDNTPSYVESALSSGIDSVQFVSNEQLIKELQKKHVL